MSRADTLIVCRTRAHQRSLLRGDGFGVSRALIWTYSDLWERLAVWACLKHGVARDELAARQLAAAVLANAGEGASAVLPRLAPALDALRRELVTAGTSSHELSAALDDEGDHDDDAVGRRGDVRRLLRLVGAVETGLTVRGIVDDELARRRALDLLRSGARPRSLAGLQQITLHLPIDLTPLDTELVMALAAVAHIDAILPVDDAVGRHAVSGAEPLFRRLEGAHQSGSVGTVDVVTDGVVGDGPLAPFRAALFGKGVVPDAPVSVVLAADAEEQSRLVVSTITAWRRTHPSHTIAVTARRQESLQTVVQALQRDGIPVRRRRRTLLESPAARLLLDMAALRTDGMPRDRLIAVLLNQARRDTLHANDAARVLTTLRRAAVRRDHEDVTQPDGGYRRRLLQLGRRDVAAVADVDFALRTIEPVMQLACSLPTSARLSVHFDAWLSLARRIVDDGRSLGGAEVFEVVARLAAGARRVGDPTAAIELLALTRLIEEELSRQPWLDDDVDVGDLAVETLTLPELAGREVDLLLVVQAVEGQLPQPSAQQASLLNDVDRMHLNGALGRRALPTAERTEKGAAGIEGVDGGLEGLWWLLGLKAARHGLVLMAPRREARGRELAPSAFLLDAARALGVSPAALHAQPVAGAPLPRATDRRQRRLSRARALVNAVVGVDDVSAADVALVETFNHARVMANEREQWFAHPERPHAARRAPYAFAVDDKRIARSFGNAFGLHASRPLTPTRLEGLAGCRMHGFVQHVLKLDVDREAGNAIEARVAGTFAHTVFERFYLDRATHRIPVSRFERNDRLRLAAIIDEETTRALQTASGHLPALRAALRFMKTSLIRVVATVSAAPPVDGVQPRDFELQIGVNTSTTTAVGPPAPISIGGGRTIFLGGIIDRVDEGPGGRVVIDYKTMSAARVKEKAAPSTLFESHFQLLVYLRLLEHHRPTTPDTPLHGYLLSLKDGAASKDIHATDSLRLRVLDDRREDSLGQAIGRVINPILDGTLPPDAGGRCTECRLQRVCRVPQEGSYHLDPDEIDDDASVGSANNATDGAKP